MLIRMWGGRVPLAGLLLVCGGSPAAAQVSDSCRGVDASAAGRVQGTVVDARTRVPLRDAEVQLSWHPEGERRSTRREVRTDARGEYMFCDAPPGERVMVKASFAGKSSRSEAVMVGAGRAVDVALEIEAPRSEIVGRVVEYGSGRPIPSATIQLRGTPLSQVTPEDGKFRFAEVPPGTYEIGIAHVGYRNVEDSVHLQLGTNMDVMARLAPNVIPLEPLVVTVRSMMLERHGFYERQQRGLGEFVTRSDFEERNHSFASELLRTIPGIRLVRRNAGVGYAPVGRASCGFRYVLNGVRVGPGFEIDDLSPEWIEALEIYRGPASIPIEFAPTGNERRASCGVIVIWTRSR